MKQGRSRPKKRGCTPTPFGQRSECEGGARPCLRLGCRYHLAAEWQLAARGGYLLVENKPVAKRLRKFLKDLEANLPACIPPTCALDVEPGEEQTLEVVGEQFGLTRERIRQLEARAKRVYRKRFEKL